jgi:hypothetical protein
MQIPSDKVLRLLGPGHPAEVRRAAAVVLGELGLRDREVSRELCEHLTDADAGLRLEVIRAVGKLRVDAALPRLLERIRDGGAEAEEAARSAARLGARGARGLQELMPRVSPGLRRYIAAALASGDGATAFVLLDHDPGVVDAATRSLMAQLPTLTPSGHKHLTEQLLELATDRKHPLPHPSALAVVRLLGVVDDARAAGALWDRVVPPNPTDVRVAALQGLGHYGAAPGKEQLKRLFACAADPDFRVAAPALVLLGKTPGADKQSDQWLALLEAPDVAVRQAALEKVGDRDTKEVAAALTRQLDHPDRGLRDAARARLAKLGHGREALTAALLAADNPDRAWQLARAQAAFVKDYPASWRDKVYAQACRRLEANDRLADPLLFLLREAGTADLRDRLAATSLAHRKKKAYDKSLIYLKLLARDPALGFDSRLELAACGLKVSPSDLSPDARAADPALREFTHLCQLDDAALVAQLGSVKWLEPEELYYLGFHLAEQDARQRKVAAEVLGLVVRRSPRSKTAQAARSKLRSAGVDL